VATPILKQGDVLIVSFQAALTDAELAELRDELTQRVGRLHSRGVIIDVSALDVMDSFATRIGVALDGVQTELDLEDGLAFLRSKPKVSGHDA
jgi:rsbT antagonist protein RsbS